MLDTSRTVIRISLILAIVVLLLLTGCSNPERLQLTEVHFQPNVTGVHFADLDGEGDVEIIPNGRINRFIPRPIIEAANRTGANVIGPAMYQMNYPDSLTIWEIVPVDIDSADGIELAISLRDYANNAAWIEILRGDSRHQLCVTDTLVGVDLKPTSGHGHRGWDGHFSIHDAVDIDGDSVVELISLVSVGHDCYPRGIYVHEYPSGELEWSFPTPGNPGYVHVVDIDDDQRQEIVFYSGVHGNRCEVDGRKDTTDYVMAVDCDGELVWSVCLRGHLDMACGGISVVDSDQDGDPEVFCSKMAESSIEGKPIRILQKRRAYDGKHLAQAVLESDHAIHHMELLDVDSDGVKELVTCGGPDVRNAATLELLGKASPCKVRIKLTGNLDNDKTGVFRVLCKRPFHVDQILPSNTMLKWFRAATQSLIGRFHFFDILCIAR